MSAITPEMLTKRAANGAVPTVDRSLAKSTIAEDLNEIYAAYRWQGVRFPGYFKAVCRTPLTEDAQRVMDIVADYNNLHFLPKLTSQETSPGGMSIAPRYYEEPKWAMDNLAHVHALYLDLKRFNATLKTGTSILNPEKDLMGYKIPGTKKLYQATKGTHNVTVEMETVLKDVREKMIRLIDAYGRYQHIVGRGKLMETRANTALWGGMQGPKEVTSEYGGGDAGWGETGGGGSGMIVESSRLHYAISKAIAKVDAKVAFETLNLVAPAKAA